MQNTHIIQQQSVSQLVNAIEFPSLSTTATTTQTKGKHKAIDTLNRLADSRRGDVGEDGDSGQADLQPSLLSIPLPSALIVCTRLSSQDLIVRSLNSHDVSIVKDHEVVTTLSKLDLARQEWRERVKQDLSSWDREVLSSGCRDREDREVLS